MAIKLCREVLAEADTLGCLSTLDPIVKWALVKQSTSLYLIFLVGLLAKECVRLPWSPAGNIRQRNAEVSHCDFGIFVTGEEMQVVVVLNVAVRHATLLMG